MVRDMARPPGHTLSGPTGFPSTVDLATSPAGSNSSGGGGKTGRASVRM
jgi:hypothetical protein